MAAPPVFPFVIGCERSGTTLLRAMLDSHPDMAVPRESEFVVQLARRRHRYSRDPGFDVDAFLADLVAEGEQFARWRLDTDDVRASFAREPPGEYADAVRRLYALYARREGKSRYGDKTTDNIDSLPLLGQLFPEARFVHLVRDGRDVALSLLELGRAWSPRTIDEAARFWKRRVLEGRDGGWSLAPHRYREVRYEALVDSPEHALGSLADFLGLAYDPAQLSYHDRARELFRPAIPEHHRRLALPPTRGLRDWRREMTSEDIARFGSIAGDLLAELGYEPG